MIGDGPLRPGIEQMARSYGVWEACRFLGRVSDAERDDWLRRAHAVRDAEPPSRPRPGRGGLRHRLPGGGRVRQAGRGGHRRRRARRGRRRRDGPAGRPAGPAPGRRGDRRRAARRGARDAGSARPGGRTPSGTPGALSARGCRRRCSVCSAAAGASGEGPLRQPHGDGQRRRALAARPARRAAGECVPRCWPRPRASWPRSRASAACRSSASAARRGRCAFTRCTRPRALAEMALAARQVRAARRAEPRRARARQLDPRGHRLRARPRRGAVARARPRLPAARSAEQRDDAADRRHRDRRARQLALHGALGARGGARPRASRSSTTRSTSRASTRSASIAQAAGPASASRRPASCSGVVAQLTPWKGQDTAIAPSPLLRAQGVDARLLLIGAASFTDSATRYDNESYVAELEALAAGAGAGRAGLLARRARGCARADPRARPAAAALVGGAVRARRDRGDGARRAGAGDRRGGPAEILEGGRGALLLPPREPEAWARAAAALAGDPARRTRIGEEGRRRAASEFGLGAHAVAMAALYDRVLAGAGARGDSLQ